MRVRSDMCSAKLEITKKEKGGGGGAQKRRSMFYYAEYAYQLCSYRLIKLVISVFIGLIMNAYQSCNYQPIKFKIPVKDRSNYDIHVE